MHPTGRIVYRPSSTSRLSAVRKPMTPPSWRSWTRVLSAFTFSRQALHGAVEDTEAFDQRYRMR